MKINRALGALMFLFIVQFLLDDAFSAFSSATVSVFGTVEAATIVAQKHLSDL